MKQQNLFEGAGFAPASAKFITSYRIALVRDRPLPFGQPTLNNSYEAKDIVRTVIKTMGQSDREQLVVILLNAKNEVVGVNLVSTGGISSAPVCPREVVKPAILSNASAIIIGHNHPSGHVEPSADDHDLTERIIKGRPPLRPYRPRAHHRLDARRAVFQLRRPGHHPPHQRHPPQSLNFISRKERLWPIPPSCPFNHQPFCAGSPGPWTCR